MHWLPTWYVSAIPGMFALGCALSAYFELRRASRRLGGELRSREDLDVVYTAITVSLRTGALMSTVYGLFVVTNCVLVAAGLFPARAAIAHVMVFSLTLLPAVPTLLAVEARLKRLRVTTRDGAIGAAYATWLREWKELRVNLSEPPPATVHFPRFGQAASTRARAA